MKLILAIAVFCALSSVCQAQQQSSSGAARSPNLENGKYIAERVAMCVQCHSPRDANGDLVRSKLFAGGPIPVERPANFRTWAEFAPRIAGLPQYSSRQFIRLVTTGVGKEGKPLRSPMPTFKLSVHDAQDVEAYLRGLE